MKRLLMTLAAILLGVLSIWPALAFFDSEPPKDAEFTYARIRYHMTPDAIYQREVPWHHDYPSSDEFFIGILHEVTGVRVTPNSYKIVRLDSPEVFQYPFLYLSEPGFMTLNEKEIANLGEYIRRGGFIMADDFRTAAYLGGPEELEVLRYFLKRALPERDLVKLDLNHPVFHNFYDIDSLKMDPPYGDFVPQFWGMSDETGKLQVIANYNNDLGDYWKYLDHGDKPLKDSSRSIRLGVNYIIYALSH